MSDTTEIVQSTIDKVLERVDALAAKLGIAAAEIWRFTVIAKTVRARANLVRGGALLFLPMLFWGWSMHVALNRAPHEVEVTTDYKYETHIGPCDVFMMDAGKQSIVNRSDCPINTQTPVPRTVEKGISDEGWGLIASAIVTFVIGLVFLLIAGDTLIDGFAATKTAEYDAYQDLIYDWKD